MITVLTDTDVRDLLVAVGANPDLTVADFDVPFEVLDLDSLARAELSAKVKHLTDVDIEDRLSEATTPNDVRRMVLDGLAAVAGR